MTVSFTRKSGLLVGLVVASIMACGCGGSSKPPTDAGADDPYLKLLFQSPDDFQLADDLFQRIPANADDLASLERLSRPQRVLYEVWGSTGLVGNGGLAALLRSDHADKKSVADCYQEIGCEVVADAYREAIEAGLDQPEKLEALSMIVFFRKREVLRNLGAYVRKHESAFASTRPSEGENLKTLRRQIRKAPPADASMDEIAFWLECIGGAVTRQNDEPEASRESDPRNPIVAIALSSSRNSTDEELRQLAQFPELKEKLRGLSLEESDVTEEGMKEVAKFTGLNSLSLAWTRVQGDWLRALDAIAELRELNLRATAISDDGLEHVGKLVSLTSLTLDDLSVTDRGVVKLAGLKSLKSLELGSTQVGDASLETIGGFPALRYLRLWETQISGRTLKPLANCRNLESLDLKGNPITDSALAELKPLKQLNYLYLDGTEINGSAFATLSDLPRLQSLSLYETRFNDEGVKHLKSLTTLRNLTIKSDNLTDAAVPHLASLTELRELSLASSKLQGGAEFRALEALTSLEYVRLPKQSAGSPDIQYLRKQLPKAQFRF